MNVKVTHTNLLKNCFTVIFMVCILSSLHLFAAKGDSKAKKGYVLKFNGFELKTLNNSALSLRLGSVYRGSFNSIEKGAQQINFQSLITYQKGNTTFIYPYKHSIRIPQFKTPEREKF